ncbi:MAG: RNA 2',3'-cyclic phosphodiesterase [Candidatus Dormibacteria bacterium]
MPRLFLALVPPAGARRRLQAPLRLLSQLGEGVHPVRDEGVHLTLCFLGEVAGGREPAVRLAAAAVAAATPAWQLQLGELGCFPPRGSPRVLWLGVGGGTEQLRRLHQRLAEEVAALGWEREGRPFHPHFTLARAPGGLTAPQRAQFLELRRRLAAESRCTFLVSSLTLVESVAQQSGGNLYRRRAAWRLPPVSGSPLEGAPVEAV